MKKLIMIMAVVAMSVSAIYADNQRSVVSVLGKAEREVEPNEITLEINVDKAILKDKMTIADAQAQMVTILKGMGVDADENFRMRDMGSSTKVGVIRDKNLQKATFTLELTKTKHVSSFINAVSRLNIKGVAIIKTDISNKEEIIMQLRIEAVKKAKVNAEALAEAIGQSIGKAVHIRSMNYNYNNYYRKTRSAGVMFSADDSNAESAGVGGSIKFENINLSCEVSVDFILE